jgi:endo-1,4-beta-mannosidase
MAMWRRFDRGAVREDLARLAAAGCDSVRIFLRWEDFQPDPRRIDEAALAKLRLVLDDAARSGLGVIPTLFTGHMSGVNWLPPWALGPGPARRFRTVSGGGIVDRATRDWATPAIRDAQALLAREAARALAGHPALRIWDLGNENSNVWVPASRDDGRRWLAAMAEAIRSVDPATPLTIGLHAEDLEEDRRIGPAEAAEVCAVLSMHGYPMYLDWAGAPDDEQVLPFLAALTRRFGGGREVLFAEFGAPTAAPDDPELAPVAAMLLSEADAAAYTARALAALRSAGCTGALLWCAADYDRAIWTEPPLDAAIHERHFGLWHADGTAKPAVAALAALSGSERAATPDDGWIDVDARTFYADPRAQLARLYRRFREGVAG